MQTTVAMAVAMEKVTYQLASWPVSVNCILGLYLLLYLNSSTVNQT